VATHRSKFCYRSVNDIIPRRHSGEDAAELTADPQFYRTTWAAFSPLAAEEISFMRLRTAVLPWRFGADCSGSFRLGRIYTHIAPLLPASCLAPHCSLSRPAWICLSLWRRGQRARWRKLNVWRATHSRARASLCCIAMPYAVGRYGRTVPLLNTNIFRDANTLRTASPFGLWVQFSTI